MLLTKSVNKKINAVYFAKLKQYTISYDINS